MIVQLHNASPMFKSSAHLRYGMIRWGTSIHLPTTAWEIGFIVFFHNLALASIKLRRTPVPRWFLKPMILLRCCCGKDIAMCQPTSSACQPPWKSGAAWAVGETAFHPEECQRRAGCRWVPVTLERTAWTPSQWAGAKHSSNPHPAPGAYKTCSWLLVKIPHSQIAQVKLKPWFGL